MTKRSRWGLFRYVDYKRSGVPHPYSIFELAGGAVTSRAWTLIAEGTHENMHNMAMILLKQAQLEGNTAIDLEQEEKTYQREKKVKELTNVRKAREV